MFCKKHVHILQSEVEFNKVIGFVESYCIEMDETGQIDFIDFTMRLLRNDMQTDYASDILYKSNKETIRPNLFPFYTYEMATLGAVTGELVEIDVSKACLISSFWKESKLKTAVRNIKKHGLISNKFRPTGHYFEEMDIGCIEDGYHHGGVASVMQTGTMIFPCVKTSKFFPLIETNGEWWIITSTKEKYLKVQDFRAAALYELAKIKYNLITKAAAD